MTFWRVGILPVAFVYFNTYVVLSKWPFGRACCPASFVGKVGNLSGWQSNTAHPQATLANSADSTRGDKLLSVRIPVVIPAGAGHAWTYDIRERQLPLESLGDVLKFIARLFVTDMQLNKE